MLRVSSTDWLNHPGLDVAPAGQLWQLRRFLPVLLKFGDVSNFKVETSESFVREHQLSQDDL